MDRRVRRGEGGRITSSIVALVSVGVIVAALVGFMLNSGGGDTGVAADTQRSANSASAPQSSTPEAGSADGSETPDAAETERGDAGSATSKSTPKPEKKPADEDTAAPAPEAEPAVPEVYVEVYNMTSVSGLAGSTAARLQDAGWQVVGVDNWRGNIPSSTVYYPAGFADEADQLADTLGIARVRGAVAPMKFDRLTVILTSDAV